MPANWILAADSSRARVFEAGLADGQINEILDFGNPQARARNRDLRTDSYGRFHASMQLRSGRTASPQVTAVEHETELFAKYLAGVLEQARNERRYRGLCLIAPPRFLGLLRANLSPSVRRLVRAEICKDLSASRADEIERVASRKLKPVLR